MGRENNWFGRKMDGRNGITRNLRDMTRKNHIWNFGFCSWGKFHYETRRALQWPESVLVGNPYSGTMLKHIKTFLYYFFCVAPIPSNILGLMKSIPLAYFGPFWSKFWAVSKKVAGRSIYTVAGGTPNSRDIFFDIIIVSHNNIGHGGALPSFLKQNSTKVWTHFFVFFIRNFPVVNPHVFSKKNMKFWLEKQHVFFLFDPHWCQSHLESFCGSPMKVVKNLWNQKCSEIISDHPRKKT